MKDKKTSNLIQYLKVISDSNRLAILNSLKKKPLCVCEIYLLLNLPQNLTSHHLRTLKNAGLITSKRVGVKIIYARNEKNINEYQNILTNIIKQ
jgi:ArsR family transcriptional regulator